VVAESVLARAPDGIRHIVEVAFSANVALDETVLSRGGSIATYATNDPHAEIPYWPLVFKNVRIDFLGSDDFPGQDKVDAARGLNEALSSGWPGFAIDERFALEAIADAHEWIEERKGTGRVVLDIGSA
jgi:NADPH2:quinone reductase